MAPTVPSPQTLTLRLKHHKTTILLHVEPYATLASLKTELLRVLQDTCPDQRLNSKHIPTSPTAIILATPKDVADPEAGWSRISTATTELEGSKAPQETIKSIGLRDGSCLAFKWRTPEEEAAEAERRKEREDDDEAMVMDGLEDLEEDEDWDVVIPVYEDAYGMENLGDVGARSDGANGSINGVGGDVDDEDGR